MDVNGAKALKERLDEHGGSEAPRTVAHVSESAAPVYHWFGIAKAEAEAEAPAPAAGDTPPVRRPWLRLLGLGSR